MALYRVSAFILLASIALAGCGNPKTSGQSVPKPVVEAVPETKATADVDRRATLVLKQDLVTRFPQNSATQAVENGLKKDGFECGPNPAAPTERACLKVQRVDACEVNTIVRSAPYAPDKAQVIKICETAPPSTKAN
jgi:hypothetical protein